MTRQEFLDNVTTFDELHSFCIDIGYDLQEEGVFSEEEYDVYIEDELYEFVRNNDWRDTRSWLSSLPDEYDFYIRDDWGEWTGRFSGDIDDLKDNVLQFAEENGFFDAEEAEEYIEEYADVEDELEEDDFEDVEDCDMGDFIWAGNAALRELQEQSEKEEAYANQTLMGVLS